ncbi:3-methylitaconate isomerase [Daldinia childiae]|uniref:3-methylitaconate isomerase n=1 Tax=Daldinia childiae TaxID=326645 RepID=UPI00144725F0|nr:3-methylitaconate isomerase [Daldinia childiae]KAF3064634.1 3-methylitaconate isomerase [Daldinia childiae]
MRRLAYTNQALRRTVCSTHTKSLNGIKYVSTTTMSPSRSFPALFVRGGTSNGLIVQRQHLPLQDQWHTVLPAAMGAPDPYGRQLNGMGGGISSTSKICVLAPSTRPDADVEFTFVQVGIGDGKLDLAGNCGNMSSAVGPVAWDEGLVGERGEKVMEGEGGCMEAMVRVFNTNTSKIIHSRFRVAGDPPLYYPEGDYEMDGVPGTQSRITLSFLDPSGAKTGKALPTGNVVDTLTLPDGSAIEASLVDVSNPGVFVRIDDLGIKDANPDTFTPQVVESDPILKARLEAIRQAGAAKMGLDPKTESVPKIILLFSDLGSADVDIRCLALSMGQAHKAVPLTLALCLGAAANMPGTLPAQVRRTKGKKSNLGPVVIGHPSGTVEIGTTTENGRIISADLLRTARVLMKGQVYY